MTHENKTLQMIAFLTKIARYYPYRFALIYNPTLQNYVDRYNREKSLGLNLVAPDGMQLQGSVRAFASLVSKQGLITPYHFKNGYLLCPIFSNLNFAIDEKQLQTISALSHAGEIQLPYLTTLPGQVSITYLEIMNPIVSKIHSIWFSLVQQAAYDAYTNLDVPYGHIYVFTTTPDLKAPLAGMLFLGALPMNDPITTVLQGNIADNTLVEVQITYTYRTYRRFYVSDKLLDSIYQIPPDNVDYTSIQPLKQLIDTFLLTDENFWTEEFEEEQFEETPD